MIGVLTFSYQKSVSMFFPKLKKKTKNLFCKIQKLQSLLRYRYSYSAVTLCLALLYCVIIMMNIVIFIIVVINYKI